MASSSSVASVSSFALGGAVVMVAVDGWTEKCSPVDARLSFVQSIGRSASVSDAVSEELSDSVVEPSSVTHL